ncbi:MAG: AIR synthase-related protein [bacterium]
MVGAVGARDLARGEVLLGEAAHGRAITRKGAKPGDIIFVTDSCGDSRAGLEILQDGVALKQKWFEPHMKRLTECHLKPEPSVDAGLAASASGAVNAMMDLSDGLAADLPRLCKRSLVGARIRAADLFISQDLAQWCEETGRKAFDYALLGGEDYNLLMAADPLKTDALFDLVETLGIRLTAIGEIAPRDEGLNLLGPDGEILPWPDAGFDHF